MQNLRLCLDTDLLSEVKDWAQCILRINLFQHAVYLSESKYLQENFYKILKLLPIFQPPFVVSLEDLELVHFERVQFQLKNFDMVFIFKDYNRKTQIVGSIPMNMLDNVKDWLNSVDIR